MKTFQIKQTRVATVVVDEIFDVMAESEEDAIDKFENSTFGFTTPLVVTPDFSLVKINTDDKSIDAVDVDYVEGSQIIYYIKDNKTGEFCELCEK